MNKKRDIRRWGPEFRDLDNLHFSTPSQIRAMRERFEGLSAEEIHEKQKEEVKEAVERIRLLHDLHGFCEGYQLTEPTDFKQYWERLRNGQASDKEKSEFDLRIMKEFYDCINREEVPPWWLMERIAVAFSCIMAGGEPNDVIRLPWMKKVISLPYTRAEWKQHMIFVDVTNALEDNPEKKVTQVIEEVAKEWNVSYELARDSYYKLKK